MKSTKFYNANESSFSIVIFLFVLELKNSIKSRNFKIEIKIFEMLDSAVSRNATKIIYNALKLGKN